MARELPQEQCVWRIAGLLQGKDVVWALGASMMLYFRGLVAEPHDVDLLVAPENVEAVDAILRENGRKLPSPPNAGYGTKVFNEYELDGVGVDLMAGLVIRQGGREYAYTLNAADCTYVERDGLRIPLSPLEDWYVLYQLMQGRAVRVAQIQGYLMEHGANRTLVDAWLTRNIPQSVRESLQELIGK